jgi:hypothetical protein
MHEAVAGWDTFYVIIGSSAAALTGLMFVVISLTAEGRMGAGSTARGLDAYASPTVVHFCLVLLVAAVLTSPLHTAVSLGLSVGIVGVSGLGYAVKVILRMRKVEAYAPVGEDWIWHVAFPLVAYLTLIVSAVVLWRNSGAALYFVAAAALLLLYTGIHNAWDTATWMAIHGKDGPSTKPSEQSDVSG